MARSTSTAAASPAPSQVEPEVAQIAPVEEIPEPAPRIEAPAVPISFTAENYRVVVGGKVVVGGLPYSLDAGRVVSAAVYNLDQLRAQGIVLELVK